MVKALLEDDLQEKKTVGFVDIIPIIQPYFLPPVKDSMVCIQCMLTRQDLEVLRNGHMLHSLHQWDMACILLINLAIHHRLIQEYREDHLCHLRIILIIHRRQQLLLMLAVILPKCQDRVQSQQEVRGRHQLLHNTKKIVLQQHLLLHEMANMQLQLLLAMGSKTMEMQTNLASSKITMMSPKRKVQIRAVLRGQDSMSSQRFQLDKKFWIGELERTLSQGLGLKS
mmetsp:Transcript_24388/g.44100  ORF Transcript_24388/g.44100 Transcript_24388/m.44100 type:complete len:226 (-) Transcript_24388:452-1129(-)